MGDSKTNGKMKRRRPMKKKFLALVLTLAMVLSLVPVTALAADTPAGGASRENTSDNLTMKKTVTPVPKKDGTYTVRLESYAKGEVTTTTTTEPLDIVLLLDVSGSMDKPFTQSSSEYRGVYDGSLKKGKTYYVKINNKYKEVKYCSTCSAWTKDCKDRFLIGHKNGEKFIPKVSEDDTDVTHTQFYEYVYTEGQSKMRALKQAVNKFIDDIAQNSPNSNVSIVKFAGEKSSDIGDRTYQDWPYTYNYTQVVKDLTQVNPSGATELKNAVSALNAAGATSSDYGLEKAQAVLNSATQKKVIVLFTDGEPNHDSGFDYEVATNAVNTAKTLKQDKTTIYTVGVFKNPDNDINLYMSSVSSNYPEATATAANNGRNWTVTNGDSDNGKHYINAENAADLINAFKTISSQVSSTHLNGNAVVVDKVPSNFKAPENDGDVTLKVANYKVDGTFDTAMDAPDEIHASVNGNGTVSVTGFDFSKNWCGLEGDTPHGQKLIIEFTIECTNYGGTQPTNAGAYIKASSESAEKIIDLQNPTVPVTISLGSNEELLKKLKVEEEKTYNGSGFAILSEVAKKVNALVNSTNIAKNDYVNMELTVTVEGTTYTYKIRAGETAGKWYEGNREMNADAVSNIKTSPNVKRGEKNAVEPYTYNFNLKLSDKTEGGAKEANYGPYSASFTIKPASVTVTANDQQVEKGTAPASITYTDTVTGLVNNEAESLISRTIKCKNYTVNTPVTSDGSELEITASGDIEQGNYTVTYQHGKLTVVAAPTGTLKVTKEVQGENLTLDKLPSDFKITVAGTGTNSTYSRELTLATQDTAEPASTTVATWTIPGLTPGTYTVSETNADVEGYTYTAKYNDVAATQANPATVDVTAGDESTMTVTNTYTKNATVDLSQLIKKQLTLKDGSTLPDNTQFTVTVKQEKVNDQTVENPKSSSGSVTVNALKSGTQNGDTYTAPFIFDNDGTLSLPAGTYTYTVQETEGDVSGMQYDSTEYTLTITVSGNGEASYQATPITIQNTYQAPDLSVTKQTVSVDGKEFDSNTVAHVGEQIVWAVSVTNKKTTQAFTQLKDTLGDVKVYKDGQEVTLTGDTWTATVPANDTVTYYVTYTVKADDILKGKIVNTIVKGDDKDHPINSDPVSTWDSKQLKSATKLDTSDWTTTVTLKLPTVNENKAETTVATDNNNGNPVEEQPIIAISKGSYVIDKIGNEFTFMDGLSLKVNDKELSVTQDETNKNLYHFRTETGGTDLYTVTYTAKDGDTPAQFKWEIKENIPAGTTVTLSYKLKLTTPKTAAGTYGVEDLNGNGQIEQGKTPIYTNESATLYKDANTKLAEFPKPSVSYTIKSSSGSHSGGSRPSLNTKDHYGYIIGYPVDYYTGQPTTDQTKKPVRPEGKITRAEVATIYFRMLTDESRTKFWSQSNSYSDVKAGDWFNNAVSTLSNAGIIAGYEDGSFRPNGYITRAEFATIAARFFDVTYNGKDLFPDISGHWAKDYINQAANKGFVNGYEDGTFKPDRNITRAEAVTLVNRTLDRHPDKNHFTKDMLVWPDNMDQTKWYYADMQEATNSHTYQMKENSDKTKYENWTKTLPIRNWEALEKAWSNANSSQGNGNVV